MSNITTVSNVSLGNITGSFVNESLDLHDSSAVSRSENTSSVNTIISDHLQADTEYVIYVIIMPILCICGITGNTLAITVFYEIVRFMKQSVHTYMFALVTVDSLSMLTFLVRCFPVLLSAFDTKRGHYLQMHSLIPIIYFDLVFNTLNSTILFIMSIERLVVIRAPLSARKTVLAKHPVRIVLAVACAIALVILPLPLCLEVVTTEGMNGTVSYQVVSKTNMEQFYFVFVLTETAICSYFPYISLMLINVAIIVQYIRYQRKRTRLFSNSNLNTSLEAILRSMATVFVIIFMYTILNLPQIFVQTLSLVNETFSIDGSESNLFWFLSDISNVLIVVNCSIDFVIYILMSAVYRQKFMQKYCSRICALEKDKE